MQDLARELNTSPATISRALNDSPQIGKEMKEKVKALANQYHFRPNSFASNLRKGKSKTIGVIIPLINRQFFSNIIHHIEMTVAEHGYNLMICQTEESYEKEVEYVDTLTEQRVSGIIIALSKQTVDYTHLEKALRADISVVQIDNVIKACNTSYIKTKDYDGAKATVRHLLHQGYRRIVFFNGLLDSQIYIDRQQGYMDALSEHNISIDPLLIFTNTNRRDTGIEATRSLLANKISFDAIFSSGDYAALGAYLVLKEHHIKIPQEVGIAGFANEYFTELVSPSITSSEQHSDEIGRQAALQIIKEITSNNTPLLKTSILPQLITRESSRKEQA